MNTDFNTLFTKINDVSTQGLLRTHPKDFIVIEHNEINLTGSGEHLWLKVEKISSNTSWVATQLASACKVPARQVGYAGLKDRHAITVQWFSVQLPKITDIDQIKNNLPDEINIIKYQWHKAKIKTGQLSHNEFNLVIRDVQGDRQAAEQNISQVIKLGVPNYFGPQRFGHDMGNIQQAKDWFSGIIKVNNKKLRGLLISTARSHIFNLIVNHRIKNNIWQQIMPGDIVQLDRTNSWFHAVDATPTELSSRLKQFDIHTTAALWGEDSVQSTAECATLENEIAQSLPEYHPGFKAHRVKQDRRATRIIPKNLTHRWHEDQLTLNFELPPGAYATSVLREIIAT